MISPCHSLDCRRCPHFHHRLSYQQNPFGRFRHRPLASRRTLSTTKDSTHPRNFRSHLIRWNPSLHALAGSPSAIHPAQHVPTLRFVSRLLSLPLWTTTPLGSSPAVLLAKFVTRIRNIPANRPSLQLPASTTRISSNAEMLRASASVLVNLATTVPKAGTKRRGHPFNQCEVIPTSNPKTRVSNSN